MKLGVYAEGVYSNQTFFANHTATLLAAPAFQPNSDSKTLFLNTYRAYKYLGIGSVNVITLYKNLDLRIEGYAFMPYQELLSQGNSRTYYGDKLNKRYFTGNATLVYNTPIGPIAMAINYYQNEPKTFNFLFHFGYIIFHKRALD